MVAVTKTVVDEGAVMVKSLHALVAIVAMSRILRPEVLAVDAHVVEVELFIDQSLHQTEEVTLGRHVPRVDQCQAVEEY